MSTASLQLLTELPFSHVKIPPNAPTFPHFVNLKNICKFHIMVVEEYFSFGALITKTLLTYFSLFPLHSKGSA